MSTVALSRNPSKAIALWGSVMAFGNPIVRLLARMMKTGRDHRVLQTLPDNVLADLGLERIEILRGPEGRRHVWVVPHRYD